MFVLISLSNKTITDHRGTVLSVKTKIQKNVQTSCQNQLQCIDINIEMHMVLSCKSMNLIAHKINIFFSNPALAQWHIGNPTTKQHTIFNTQPNIVCHISYVSREIHTRDMLFHRLYHF